MKKILFVTIVSLVALCAANEAIKALVSAQRDEDGRFIISILRADGTLVPFAQYGNGGWWNPWPKPRESAESVYAESAQVTHHSLADLPEPWFKQCGKIPTTWYFWPSNDPATVLTASKVIQVTAHSGTNWALLTDFPNKTAEDGLDNNIGVALSVNRKVEPLIEIKTASADETDIVSFIKQVFDEDETAALDRLRAESSPGAILSTPDLSLSREERRRIAMSITKLYRSSIEVNGEHLYYFEAEKEYPHPVGSSNRDCNDVTLFQGWISTTGKGGMSMNARPLMFTNCDRKGPSTTTPLGIMKIDNRTFLFLSEHGWESESYIILELDNSGLDRILETFGG